MEKKLQIYCILILGFGCFANLLSAQNEGYEKVRDVTDFRRQMEAITLNTITIRSEFVQEKQLSFMEEPIVSSGQFFFKKEQKIRWEYQQPFSYTVILNDNNLMINDEGHIHQIDLKGNKTFQEINTTIHHSLQGNIWSNSKDFVPVLWENENFYLIELTPQTKEIKTYLTKINVFFDKKSYQLAKVLMMEKDGDFTKITFQRQKINEPIKDELFRL